jgi:hypothetical protein
MLMLYLGTAYKADFLMGVLGVGGNARYFRIKLPTRRRDFDFNNQAL